jgi:hypothetical protein
MMATSHIELFRSARRLYFYITFVIVMCLVSIATFQSLQTVMTSDIQRLNRGYYLLGLIFVKNKHFKSEVARMFTS